MRFKAASVKLALRRIGLTLFALWGLGVLLYLFEQGLFLSRPLPERPDVMADFALDEGPTEKVITSRTGLKFPAFPSRKRLRSNPMKINGIMVNSESFETTARPQAILDFYVDQMTARGWKDITEDAHNSTPELLASSRKGARKQNQQALAMLDNYSNSELILDGGDHIMHVNTKRGSKRWFTAATVVVSASRSVEEMGTLIDIGIKDNIPRRGMRKFMDVTEYGVENTYRTRQWVTREDPYIVFSRMADELIEEGWETAIPDLIMREGLEYFGTFMHKDKYAVLSVSPQPDINGAMASLSISQ